MLHIAEYLSRPCPVEHRLLPARVPRRWTWRLLRTGSYKYAMLVLIKNGEVYGPGYIGQASILLWNNSIAKIGQIDEHTVRSLGLEVEVVDAHGCVVIPGLIDPHVHLIGGGGEAGFASRTPEIQLGDIVRSGITTVVGCLGTDGTTRHVPSLLAKARGLEEEGVTAYIYTGNYHVPTPTITGSIRDDVILIDKVIGAGEIAISDRRSSQPSLHELARVVSEAAVGGLLSGKAGVTHFHVGSGKQRLTLLHTLLEEYEVAPTSLYATHITRSESLMDDAVALSKKGAFVDIDTSEGDLAKWLAYFREHGGAISQLTISSDGNGSLPTVGNDGQILGVERTSPHALFEQFAECVVEHGMPVEDVLPHLTLNTANVLKLNHKGQLKEGLDADVLVLRKATMDIVDVFARGRPMMRDGKVTVTGTFE